MIDSFPYESFDFNSDLDSNQVEMINNIMNLKEIDIISISNGIYNVNKQLIYPPKNFSYASILSKLTSFISKTDKIWNICGNVRNLDLLNSDFPNLTYSIGRPIIADPNFVNKQFEGNHDKLLNVATPKNVIIIH